MFTIIGIMLTGMLVGYLLRSKRLLWIHKVITLLIWLLLFLLGIDVGGNETIIRNLHAIGLEALAIRRRCRKRTGSMGTVVPCIYKE